MKMAGMKWGLNYELAIEMDPGTSEAIIIRPPLTLTFNIVRNTLHGVNTATISVYNLKESTRRIVYHDRINTDTKTYRRIVLRAGYGNDMPIVFRGNIREASSARQGVNYITEIEAFDGGDAVINGFTVQTWPAGTNIRAIMTDIVKNMPNVVLGKIGDFSGTSYRGTTVVGNSWEMLVRISGDQAQPFIDNEKVNVLGVNEVIGNGFRILDASTGLLDTPKRQDTVLEIKTLLEPHLEIGQVVELRSMESLYNGRYKVCGLVHSGTISEAVGSVCTTEASLYLGTAALKEVA